MRSRLAAALLVPLLATLLAAAPAPAATAEEDLAFLTATYRELLGRAPDPSGIATYIRELSTRRMTRDQVRRAILASPEYRGKHPGGSAPPAGGSGTLDDLFRGQPGPVAVHPGSGDAGGDGFTECRVFDLPPSRSGYVEIETAGITHLSEPNKGGWEWIFLSLRGKDFARIILHHAAGKGRASRFYIDCPEVKTLKCEIATDDLPDWHTWRIQWGGGKVSYFLDGKRLGTLPFNGQPTKAWAGGYWDGFRNFKGRWRNFKYVPGE